MKSRTPRMPRSQTNRSLATRARPSQPAPGQASGRPSQRPEGPPRIDLTKFFDLRLTVGIEVKTCRIPKEASEFFFRAFVVSRQDIVIITAQKGSFEDYQVLRGSAPTFTYRVTPADPRRRIPIAKILLLEEVAQKAAEEAGQFVERAAEQAQNSDIQGKHAE